MDDFTADISCCNTTSPSFSPASSVNSTSDGHVRASTVIVGVVLAIIIVLTLFGNTLVVAAVAKFHRLRNVTNYLLVSLAIADLTVAILVMPYALLYHIVGSWQLGWVFCNFFISCDVMCCTASILHLCIISLDRYCAITDPLSYNRRMSKRRAAGMIAGVWICSVLISFIPIFLGWYTDTESVARARNSNTCLLEVNPTYAVVSSTTSFYLPLLVMLLAYAAILKIAERQAREIAKLEASLAVNRPVDVASGGNRRRAKRDYSDHKAVRTLGILMGLFCICWLPFFLLYVVKPFCSDCAVSARTESAITWLGYCNSFLNPCIYACLNRDFRLAFRRILSPVCCCCVQRRGEHDAAEVARCSADDLRSTRATVVHLNERLKRRCPLIPLGKAPSLIALVRRAHHEHTAKSDVATPTPTTAAAGTAV